MSISLAYNELDFQNKELQKNSWTIKHVSPFAHTYNLRLLNLSHNKFGSAFEDWWINGHEIVDVSSNRLEFLWVCNCDYNNNGIIMYDIIFVILNEKKNTLKIVKYVMYFRAMEAYC